MYWDGEEHPSVECPIGDFFGMGHGLDKPFTSLPVRVSSDGRGRNCYWPMPFRKSARITVTNDERAGAVTPFTTILTGRNTLRCRRTPPIFTPCTGRNFPASWAATT